MITPERTLRALVVVALMASVLMHGALVALFPHRPVTAPAGFLETAGGVCCTIAVAGLLTSLYWTLTKLPKAPDSKRFLVELVIALALSEVSSLAGLFLFFVGHNAAQYGPFGAGSLLVQGLFILPRALRRE